MKTGCLLTIKWEKMKCKDFNKMLILYLDGNIAPDYNEAFQEHLNTCSKCQNELSVLKTVYESIDAERKEYNHNHFFATRVLSRIQVRNQGVPRHESIQRYVSLTGLAVAAGVMGILIGTFFARTTSTFDSTSTQSWEQLADDYMPEYDSNPYQFVNENNQ